MTSHTQPSTRTGSSQRRIWRSGLRARTDLRHLKGDFAVIGDVHGCWYTLNNLIETIGGTEGQAPEGMTFVSVGDLHDKGGRIGHTESDPTTSGAVNVLRWALQQQSIGKLIAVDSNHGRHLAQRIAKNTAMTGRGCGEITYLDLVAQPDAVTLIPQVSRFLHGLPPFVRLNGGPTGELVVAHAAVIERLLDSDALRRAEYDYFLFTEEKFRWTGPQTVITGHVQVPEPSRLTQGEIEGRRVGDVLRIDTGVNKGGGLSAYLPHLDRFVSVPTDPRDIP